MKGEGKEAVSIRKKKRTMRNGGREGEDVECEAVTVRKGQIEGGRNRMRKGRGEPSSGAERRREEMDD